MIKKLKINFESYQETPDSVISKALITQLMLQIAKIGVRTNNFEKNNSIIIKEKNNVNEK